MFDFWCNFSGSEDRKINGVKIFEVYMNNPLSFLELDACCVKFNAYKYHLVFHAAKIWDGHNHYYYQKGK